MVLGCARHMRSNHNESASREITHEAHAKSLLILWLSAFRSVWSSCVPRTPRSRAASLIPQPTPRRGLLFRLLYCARTEQVEGFATWTGSVRDFEIF